MRLVEFISKAFDAWAYRNGVTLEFSRPGKPTDNAFVQSVNGNFRQECLDQLMNDNYPLPADCLTKEGVS